MRDTRLTPHPGQYERILSAMPGTRRVLTTCIDYEYEYLRFRSDMMVYTTRCVLLKHLYYLIKHHPRLVNSLLRATLVCATIRFHGVDRNGYMT